MLSIYDWENEGGAMGWGGKNEIPCEKYWGNVCCLTCYRCGWERDEHSYEKYHAKHRAEPNPFK